MFLSSIRQDEEKARLQFENSQLQAACLRLQSVLQQRSQGFTQHDIQATPECHDLLQTPVKTNVSAGIYSILGYCIVPPWSCKCVCIFIIFVFCYTFFVYEQSVFPLQMYTRCFTARIQMQHIVAL